MTMETVSLVRIVDVMARTGLKKTALYDLIRRGEFPTAVPIGKRAVAWDSREVDDWIRDRIKRARVARADDARAGS